MARSACSHVFIDMRISKDDPYVFNFVANEMTAMGEEALHYWINVLAGISAIRNGGSTEVLNVHFSF